MDQSSYLHTDQTLSVLETENMTENKTYNKLKGDQKHFDGEKREPMFDKTQTVDSSFFFACLCTGSFNHVDYLADQSVQIPHCWS